jgi:hypothetical protein
MYKAVILPDVLFGSLTWREEHRLRLEIMGHWRKWHNEELHNLYSSPTVITVIKSGRLMWAWHVACLGGMRSACRILVRKPKGRGHLGNMGIDGRIIHLWGCIKSFQNESVTKYMLTFGINRWEATQRVMVVELISLTHKVALHLT